MGFIRCSQVFCDRYQPSTTTRIAEQTMALLVFDSISDSPLSELMDLTQRQKVADEVNPAILRYQLEVGEIQ